MDIVKNLEGSKLVLALVGRLDTTTAPQLEAEIENLEGVSELELDFAKLEYVSSAGLRLLLSAQKKMMKQGSMVILNANDSIKEIFSVTGFDEILTIK